LYLVDLPGYGYARGGPATAREFEDLTRAYFSRSRLGALLLVDARHPGLDSDLDAWQWLRDVAESPALIATKIDKLARGERIRTTRQLESVFDTPVLPVSAVTGEGLEELWKLIDRQANSRNSRTRGRSRPTPEATVPLRPPTGKAATSRKR
jgi:GTP-binding protein